MTQINRKIARIQKNLSCSNVRHPSNGLQIQGNLYPNFNVMGGTMLEFILTHKSSRYPKTILSTRNKFRDTVPPDFKVYRLLEQLKKNGKNRYCWNKIGRHK